MNIQVIESQLNVTGEKRWPLIDIARGLTISLVVLGHGYILSDRSWAEQAMGVLRMPAFFIIAGTLFTYRGSFRSFVVRRTDSLIKPFIVASLLFLAGDVFFGERRVLIGLAGIAYANGNTMSPAALWFLPHLWLVGIIAFFLVPLAHRVNRKSLLMATTIAILVGGAIIRMFWEMPVPHVISGVTSKAIPGLPLGVDFVLITLGFFIIGQVFRFQIFSFVPKLQLVILTGAAFILLMATAEPHVDLNLRVFTPAPAALIAVALAVYLFLTVCWLISRADLPYRVFAFLGRRSLFVLLFHIHLADALRALLGSSKDSYEPIIYLLSLVGSAVLYDVTLRSSLLSALFLPLKSASPPRSPSGLTENHDDATCSAKMQKA